MGKKGKGQVLGRSIIKERFAKKRPIIGSKGETFLHTSELEDGYNWGRLNLMSVTEQSNLEDFLATAEMAGTEFTAEKLNVKFIDRNKDSGLPSEQELKRLKEAQERNKTLLRIPRRPKWDSSTSADELLARERESFLQWRKTLAYLQEEEQLILTPYEKNLEFWRQLWRVIERSDVIVQIVDARNPLLFHCQDLKDYIKEIDPNKISVVLINKADFLSYKQRKDWAIYFGSQGVKVAFWSALQEMERQEQSSRLERNAEKENDLEEFSIPERKDEKHEIDEKVEKINAELETDENKAEKGEEIANEVPAISGEASLDAALNSLCLEPADSDNDESETEESKAVVDNSPLLSSKIKLVNFAESLESEEDNLSPVPVINSAEVLDADRLLEFLKSLHTGPKVREGTTTIGMVGYPNVGKSSTINSILRTKKVPVSATPGRTKHFQTLYVEKTLLICDCPGLVFPSFVSTKAELIVNGILPIDQMRDHVPPTSLVCERIPRQFLEDLYGILIPAPGDCEDPQRPPTALELLNAYGYMRGFMTQSSVPDCPRSARYILKDYVNGKLLFCHPPPGMNAMTFQQVHGSTEKGKKKGNTAPKKEAASKQKKLDSEFFTPSHHSASSVGSRGVKGYVRLNGLKQVGCSEGQEIKNSGKKHHKKKKDKLRRLYAHLDKH